MRRAVILVVLSSLVLLAVVYLWSPSSVPPGQESLVVLSNANSSEFENAFDTGSDALRLVLLLSPT
jgi:hypothetical protein